MFGGVPRSEASFRAPFSAGDAAGLMGEGSIGFSERPGERTRHATAIEIRITTISPLNRKACHEEVRSMSILVLKVILSRLRLRADEVR